MTKTVRLVRRDDDQFVLLPVDLHLQTDRVRVRRHGRRVLIEPVCTDVRQWFAELDSPTRESQRRTTSCSAVGWPCLLP
jgi:virulence-associated protein VagC